MPIPAQPCAQVGDSLLWVAAPLAAHDAPKPHAGRPAIHPAVMLAVPPACAHDDTAFRKVPRRMRKPRHAIYTLCRITHVCPDRMIRNDIYRQRLARRGIRRNQIDNQRPRHRRLALLGLDRRNGLAERVVGYKPGRLYVPVQG